MKLLRTVRSAIIRAQARPGSGPDAFDVAPRSRPMQSDSDEIFTDANAGLRGLGHDTYESGNRRSSTVIAPARAH
jgi:hypothetical protein